MGHHACRTSSGAHAGRGRAPSQAVREDIVFGNDSAREAFELGRALGEASQRRGHVRTFMRGGQTIHEYVPFVAQPGPAGEEYAKRTCVGCRQLIGSGGTYYAFGRWPFCFACAEEHNLRPVTVPTPLHVRRKKRRSEPLPYPDRGRTLDEATRRIP